MKALHKKRFNNKFVFLSITIAITVLVVLFFYVAVFNAYAQEDNLNNEQIEKNEINFTNSNTEKYEELLRRINSYDESIMKFKGDFDNFKDLSNAQLEKIQKDVNEINLDPITQNAQEIEVEIDYLNALIAEAGVQLSTYNKEYIIQKIYSGEFSSAEIVAEFVSYNNNIEQYRVLANNILEMVIKLDSDLRNVGESVDKIISELNNLIANLIKDLDEFRLKITNIDHDINELDNDIENALKNSEITEVEYNDLIAGISTLQNIIAQVNASLVEFKQSSEMKKEVIFDKAQKTKDAIAACLAMKEELNNRLAKSQGDLKEVDDKLQESYTGAKEDLDKLAALEILVGNEITSNASKIENYQDLAAVINNSLSNWNQKAEQLKNLIDPIENIFNEAQLNSLKISTDFESLKKDFDEFNFKNNSGMLSEDEFVSGKEKFSNSLDSLFNNADKNLEKLRNSVSPYEELLLKIEEVKSEIEPLQLEHEEALSAEALTLISSYESLTDAKEIVEDFYGNPPIINADPKLIVEINKAKESTYSALSDLHGLSERLNTWVVPKISDYPAQVEEDLVTVESNIIALSEEIENVEWVPCSNKPEAASATTPQTGDSFTIFIIISLLLVSLIIILNNRKLIKKH